MNRKSALVVSVVGGIVIFLIFKGQLTIDHSDGSVVFAEKLSQIFGVQIQKHVALVHELQRMHHEGKFKSAQDLAKLDEAAWADLIKKEVDGHQIGYPSDISGKDDAEKSKNYARMLARLVEEAYPTQVFAHLIKQDDKKLPEHDDLIRFFHNNPDFDFRKTAIVSYLKKNGSYALEDVDDKEGIIRTLKSIQRLYKITPRCTEILELLTAGFESACDIIQFGQTEFVATYAMRLGSVERASEIYFKSRNLESTDHNSDESE